MKLNKSCECPVVNEGAITELHNQEKWEMEKKTCEYYWASSVLDKLDEIMDRTYNPSWTSSIAASMVRRSENTAWNHQAARYDW